MDTTATQQLTGHLLNERYLVGPRIARGGMAVVYEGTDTRLERRVALKVMHPGLAEDPEFVQRFVREARSAARLSHPNIVAVHDQGADEGEIYLVMEHVTGSTLRDLLRARGRLTVNEALDILDPLLDALTAAHTAGLVHRDVKPENVLITDDGRIKVADFGLARATSSITNATQGVLIGTVAYLSPEQVRGATGDERSDVYSAGICLFEMLTGHPPYDGDTPTVVAVRHANEDVPAPSSLVPGLPAALDALVAGATTRDPQVRYRDAEGFLAASRATRQRLGLPQAAPLAQQAPEPAFHDTLVVSHELPATSRAAAPVAAWAGVAARSTATNREGSEGASQPPGSHHTGVLPRELDAEGSGRGPAASSKSARGSKNPKTPRRSRRGLIAFFVVMALAIGAGTAAWALARTPQVDVPAVIGLSQAAAQDKLAAAGLSVAFANDVFSEKVPVGNVISTTPAAAASVAADSTVTLALSKGPERYAVPNLAGRTTADATSALKATKLSPGRTTEAFSSTVGKGLVISTDPKAGTKLKRDTTVNLTVSKGAQPIKVPTVTGKTQAQAQAALTSAGLKFKVSQQFSATVANGIVISQSPTSGTLARGGTVNLNVSKGPPPVLVPNVLSKKIGEATAILQKAGLKVRVVTNVPGGPNVVIQQTPGRGTSVPRGTTINLYIF